MKHRTAKHAGRDWSKLHALEWIRHGAGKYCRKISAKQLRNVLRRPAGVCLWCCEKCRGGDIAFCTSRCYQDFITHCQPQRARNLVGLRDEGCCLSCGEVVEKWEADHVLPVERGGGLCELANLATKCPRCHEAKSRAETAIRVRPTSVEVGRHA